MAYGWGEHVGELALWIEAASEEDVFAEALAALADLLAGDGSVGGSPAEWREVAADGADRAVLLADWIEQLAFLAETEGFVPDAVDELVLAPGALRATVGGHRGAPPHLVKAVTYHGLRFERRGSGWRAEAVLDV
jgi:SHS2 domain-containing protein